MESIPHKGEIWLCKAQEIRCHILDTTDDCFERDAVDKLAAMKQSYAEYEDVTEDSIDLDGCLLVQCTWYRDGVPVTRECALKLISRSTGWWSNLTPDFHIKQLVYSPSWT